MKQLKETSKRVKQLMELIQMLRDSDKHLISAIHREDMANAGLISANASYKDFEDLFLYGDIITPPSRITRARRIIQHKYQNLRGVTYEARQAKAGRIRQVISK